MVGLLIIPILVCGYIYISTWPSERIRIHIHQGWSLYLRAAYCGSIVFFCLTFVFGIALPKTGLYIGDITGVHFFPNTNIYNVLTDMMLSTNFLDINKIDQDNLRLNVVSLSVCSIALTWLIALPINIISSDSPKWIKSFFMKIPFAKKIDSYKKKTTEELYAVNSAIQHQFLIIMQEAQRDLTYNQQISETRKKVVQAIRKKELDRHNKALMEKIFNELRYRHLNYALVTLEGGKFYVGIPVVLSAPDQDSLSFNSTQIMPVASGYRDEKKKLVFTTEYQFELSSAESGNCVSFSREKIISVSGFKFKTHEILKNQSQLTDRSNRYPDIPFGASK